MGQWLQMCAQYLHLLLENKGLTRAAKCSSCNAAMEVKCSDCLGGNYFCRDCCVTSHKHTPFHQLACWTGSHFTPVSLHSLGFLLFLGHHGNPCPLTVEQMVHQSGIFSLEILYCICPKAVEKHEQFFNTGLFPSSFKQIETVFTFAVLDDFLADNLECKTTAQQYYSKLQSITNQMFPDSVPNLYKQLLRASRQWHDIRTRTKSGLGHEGGPTEDGSMAIFCPACPQPGINLPSDWEARYTLTQLIYTFIMNGNFSAEHMKCRSGEQDTLLSSGMAFMAHPDPYSKHLESGKEITQVSTCNTYKAIKLANSTTACCHGFFVPTSVVDFQKGESLCKALSYNMESIPIALVMYDIMCQYKVHLKERVQRSPELSIPDSLELHTGIGLFHIHGHQDSCLPCFSPSYIPGAKQVDGEIIEMLWAPLNNISWSIRGMSLAHHQEVLDAHMNHSNWKKMVHIGQLYYSIIFT
ncbi:hypothetical protein V8E53_015547 [Lactarius tabidus]